MSWFRDDDSSDDELVDYLKDRESAINSNLGPLDGIFVATTSGLQAVKDLAAYGSNASTTLSNAVYPSISAAFTASNVASAAYDTAVSAGDIATAATSTASAAALDALSALTVAQYASNSIPLVPYELIDYGSNTSTSALSLAVAVSNLIPVVPLTTIEFSSNTAVSALSLAAATSNIAYGITVPTEAITFGSNTSAAALSTATAASNVAYNISIPTASITYSSNTSTSALGIASAASNTAYSIVIPTASIEYSSNTSTTALSTAVAASNVAYNIVVPTASITYSSNTATSAQGIAIAASNTAYSIVVPTASITYSSNTSTLALSTSVSASNTAYSNVVSMTSLSNYAYTITTGGGPSGWSLSSNSAYSFCNVGIGTSATSSYQLTVNGSASVQRLVIDRTVLSLNSNTSYDSLIPYASFQLTSSNVGTLAGSNIKLGGYTSCNSVVIAAGNGNATARFNVLIARQAIEQQNRPYMNYLFYRYSTFLNAEQPLGFTRVTDSGGWAPGTFAKSWKVPTTGTYQINATSWMDSTDTNSRLRLWVNGSPSFAFVWYDYNPLSTATTQKVSNTVTRKWTAGTILDVRGYQTTNWNNCYLDLYIAML